MDTVYTNENYNENIAVLNSKSHKRRLDSVLVDLLWNFSKATDSSFLNSKNFLSASIENVYINLFIPEFIQACAFRYFDGSKILWYRGGLSSSDTREIELIHKIFHVFLRSQLVSCRHWRKSPYFIVVFAKKLLFFNLPSVTS